MKIKIFLMTVGAFAYTGALFSADHVSIRNIMIESQLAQVEKMRF